MIKEVSALLREVLKPILKNYSPVILIVRRNWNSLIDSKYCEFCEPEKILFKKGKKNDATLYIKCFNAVISFYIENNKLFIVDKINSIFGYNLISSIKIRQDPQIIKNQQKPKSILIGEDLHKIDATIINVENADLKKSLKELGNSLFINK